MMTDSSKLEHKHSPVARGTVDDAGHARDGWLSEECSGCGAQRLRPRAGQNGHSTPWRKLGVVLAGASEVAR